MQRKFNVDENNLETQPNSAEPSQIEYFLSLCVSGTPQCTAYSRAFKPPKNVNKKALSNAAQSLLNKPNIRKRYNEMLAERENRLLNDQKLEFEKIKSLIWSRIDVLVNKNKDSDVSRYLDILNKMNGFYNNDNMETEKNNSLNSLNIEELKAIINIELPNNSNMQ